MVLGNKIDTLQQEELEKAQVDLDQLKLKHRVEGFLVSAKTGQNVFTAFEQLTRVCVKFFGTSTKDSSQTQTVVDDIRRKKR
jgi:GTPase involved in cell partitioning and DNA repair